MRYYLNIILGLGIIFLNCISSGPESPPDQSKEEELKEYLERGDIYFKSGNYPAYRRAEAQYLRAIEIDPACAAAYNRLGYIYYIYYEKALWDNKPAAEAIRHYNYSSNCFLHALKYRPDYVESYIGLSILEFCARRYDKAIDYLLNARVIPTEDKSLKAQIHLQLGRCYNALERFREAYDELEGYLKIFPKGEEADNVRKTLEDIRRTLGLPPENKPEPPPPKE